MKIAALDPGKQKSQFGFVGIDVKDNKIYILGAKRWGREQYTVLEDYIANEIHPKHRFNFYVVEINNVGIHVAEVLEQKHLPIVAVNTSANLKKDNSKTMDKNAMVNWLLQFQQQGRLIWPNKTTPEVEELKRQWSLFEEHKTDAGRVSYHAPGEEYDDLTMALILACWLGRQYIDNDQTMVVASHKHQYGHDKDEWGSGIPKHIRDWESVRREVYMP